MIKDPILLINDAKIISISFSVAPLRVNSPVPMYVRTMSAYLKCIE